MGGKISEPFAFCMRKHNDYLLAGMEKIFATARNQNLLKDAGHSRK
jgi:hypothetical protein